MQNLAIPEKTKKIVAYIILGSIVKNTIDSLGRFHKLNDDSETRLIFNRIKENILTKGEM